MSQEVVAGETVGLDSLFEALGDEHRLRVLVNLYLADEGAQLRAEDLVRVDEAPGDVVPPLYHVHFPKLEAVGLVEWDREANAVRRGPAFRSVDRLFDCLNARDGDASEDLARHAV